MLLTLISCYRVLISSWMPARCRYYPSCSEYAAQCLKSTTTHHAVFKIVSRILRCNPWSPGGIDLP